MHRRWWDWLTSAWTIRRPLLLSRSTPRAASLSKYASAATCATIPGRCTCRCHPRHTHSTRTRTHSLRQSPLSFMLGLGYGQGWGRVRVGPGFSRRVLPCRGYEHAS